MKGSPVKTAKLATAKEKKNPAAEKEARAKKVHRRKNGAKAIKSTATAKRAKERNSRPEGKKEIRDPPVTNGAKVINILPARKKAPAIKGPAAAKGKNRDSIKLKEADFDKMPFVNQPFSLPFNIMYPSRDAAHLFYP